MERTAFHLRVGPLEEGDVRVTRITAYEALSEPFRFDVDLTSATGAHLDLAALLRGDAALRLRSPGGGERCVYGICGRAEDTGLDSGVPSARVAIVPRLALLGQERDCRVFQGRTIPEIVEEVLDASGVPCRLALRDRYTAREMCVQYRETGLDFVARLLEEEGIAYWFEHGGDGDVLVMGDAPSAFAPMPDGDLLPWRDDHGGVAGEEYLFGLRCSQRVKPGRTSSREFDFERPTIGLSADASDGTGVEVYEHGAGRLQPADAKRACRARLEELRFGAETWRGEAICPRISPGWLFEVGEPPDLAFARRLLAVRVEHELRQQPDAGAAGGLGPSYRTRFLALEAGRPYRPRRRTPRPLIAGVQTATVVGPAGEEIHPDRHGRLKIRFHWDREGGRDDRASAWVRTAQAWAGGGMGAAFVPRAGQEVLLRFLEGNPDRPIVAGAVYNGANVPPVDLPADKTRSTLRSDSSPGGGGSNELRFEDQEGAEEVYLHAQRNETIAVGADKSQRIRESEALRVDGDRRRQVGAEQGLRVTLEDGASVGGNQLLVVAGDRATTVGGDADERVEGPQTVAVAGARTVRVNAAAAESIGAAAALNVGGAYVVNVGGVLNEAVVGLKSGQVGGERIEIVGAAREEHVHGDGEARVGGGLEVDVVGHASIRVEKDLEEKVSGRTEITAAAAAFLRGKKVMLEADRVTIVVDGAVALTMSKSGAIDLFGKNVTLEGTEIQLKGAAVKKVAAGSGPEQERETETASLTLKRLYHDDDPVQGAKYEVLLADGTIVEGTLDKNGEAQLQDLPAKARMVRFGPDARPYERVDKEKNPKYREQLTQADIEALVDARLRRR